MPGIAASFGIRCPVRLRARSPQRIATEHSHRDTHGRQYDSKKQCEQDTGIDPSHRLRDAPPETIRHTQGPWGNEPKADQKSPDNEQDQAQRRRTSPPEQGRHARADASDAKPERTFRGEAGCQVVHIMGLYQT